MTLTQFDLNICFIFFITKELIKHLLIKLIDIFSMIVDSFKVLFSLNLLFAIINKNYELFIIR